MTEPVREWPIDEVGAHIADLRLAAQHGDVVYLTERGERLAAVIPLHRKATQRGGGLADVVGTLSDFERFVDVETSRDDWDRQ
jgi:antitoxin (DNA-binding transcriptional repressor) of toxin-antitoxin stability system